MMSVEPTIEAMDMDGLSEESEDWQRGHGRSDHRRGGRRGVVRPTVENVPGHQEMIGVRECGVSGLAGTESRLEWVEE